MSLNVDEIDDFFVSCALLLVHLLFSTVHCLRANDVCRQAFMFCVCSCFDTQTLPDGRAAPRQKYIGGLIVGRTSKIHSDISPIPHLNFAGGGGQKTRNFA